jgi:hypothetical protein
MKFSSINLEFTDSPHPTHVFPPKNISIDNYKAENFNLSQRSQKITTKQFNNKENFL